MHDATIAQMKKEKSSVNPIGILTVSVILTVILVSLLLYENVHHHQEKVEHMHRQIQMETVKGKILLHNEVLMSATRMIAFTEEPKWLDRYSIHRTKLSHALDTAQELARTDLVHDAIKQLREVSDQLRLRESKVLENIHSGEKSTAHNLLDQNDYRIGNQSYKNRVHELSASSDRSARLAQLGSTIHLLDEILTMSAKLAAVSGNEKWIRQYDISATLLNTAINDAITLSTRSELKEALASTQVANEQLIRIEEQSLTLVKKQQLESSYAMLNSQEYIDHKDSYAQAITEFMNALQKEIQNLQTHERSKLGLNTAYAIIAILLIIVSWVVVLTLVRKSRTKADEKNARLHLVVEAAPSGMIMIDAHGTIVLANAMVCEQFGYTRETLLGQSIETLIPERFRAQHPDHRTHFFASPEPRTMGSGRELYGLRQDGTEFPVEIGLNPLTTDEGTFVLASIVDISERKHAQESLTKSESRSRLLLNSAGEGIYGLDAQGNTTFVNQAAATMLGYAAEELIGVPMHATMHHTKADGSPYPREECPMYAAFKDGSIQNIENEILWKKDGTSFPVDYTSRPVRNENGLIEGAVVTFRDVSIRKKEEEKFRLVVEAAPSGMIMIDESGTIVLANTMMCEQFGYARDILLGLSIETLIPERFRGEHPDHRTKFFAAPEPRTMGSGRELYGLRQDGTEFPVEIGLNPLTTDEGTFVLASVVDITARKKAEEKFRLVVEAAPSGMIMIDARGTIVLANAMMCEQFGYTRETLLGQSIEILIPDRFRPQHPDHRTKFFTAPEPRTMGSGRELYGLRQDGTEFPVEIGLNPLTTDEGTFVLASVVDITERQTLIESVKDSEHRLKMLIDGVKDYSIYMLDPSGYVQSWNSGAERLKGYREDEIIGQHFSCFFPSTDVAADHPNEILQLAATQDGYEEEGWRVRKDGSQFWAHAVISPIFDDMNGLTGFSKVVEDRTLQKKAEEKFRLVVEAAPSGMIMIDHTGTIVLANALMTQQFGYEKDELLGQSIETLIPERFRPQHPGHRTHFFAAPEPRTMGSGRELYGLRQDGTEFPVEIGLNPLTTDEGTFVLASIVDITARKKAEEKFRLVVEAAPSGMIMIDHTGTIVLVNAMMCEQFGYTRETLLGQSIETLIPERFRPQHPDHRTKFFTAPEPRTMGSGRDLYGLRQDGTEFPVEIGLNPLTTDEGPFVLASVVDITQRKNAEEALARYIDDLRRSNSELEQFAYVASHDLQEPLRKIRNYSELLDSRYKEHLPPDALKFLNPIVDGATRMQVLVQDLLAFSRVARGELVVQATDLHVLVHNVHSALETLITDRQATVTIGALPTLDVNPSQIEQLFQNLIGNGIKYNRSDSPTIEVSATLKATDWEFAVRDNGIGIDPQYTDRIFVIFQRLHTKKEYSGTGIGLAICKKIVELHGGQIWMESQEGTGSTFFFTLPK